MCYDRSTVDISSSNLTFSSNSASYGGVLMCYVNSALNVSSSDLAFSGNSANNGGVLFCSSNSTVSMSGLTVTFLNNIATISGGVLYCSNNATLNISSSNLIFSGNVTESSGGAIYCSGSMVTFDNSEVIFENNKAQSAEFGHDIYIRRGTINIIGAKSKITISSGIAGAVGSNITKSDGI
jgi:predicted outer membrane repeat protein